MSTIEVKVPDIGDFKDVPVIEVFVKPGDTVKAEDSLVTLESDKATMDVPAPAAGTVKELKVKVGDKVSEGSVILVLETQAGAPAPAPSKVMLASVKPFIADLDEDRASVSERPSAAAAARSKSASQGATASSMQPRLEASAASDSPGTGFPATRSNNDALGLMSDPMATTAHHKISIRACGDNPPKISTITASVGTTLSASSRSRPEEPEMAGKTPQKPSAKKPPAKSLKEKREAKKAKKKGH